MSGITQGVKDFLKSSHKADSTEVCSEVAPEIVQETIKPVEKHEVAEAIDREKHIHHHQHRVQPIADKQVLPTQHTNQIDNVVVREHKEDMLPEHQAKLHEQRTLHQAGQTVAATERTNINLGQHVNTHEHHHIHETIQPVIQRETIQQTHIHHTIPVTEKIHEAPIVHEATTLPTITHEQFLKQKASAGAHTHSDKDHSHQYYEGAPRVGGGAAAEGSHGITGSHGTTGSGLTGNHGTTGSGLTGSHGTTGTGLTGNHGTTGATTGAGLTGAAASAVGHNNQSGHSGLVGNNAHQGSGVVAATTGSTTTSNTTGTEHKGGLIEKVKSALH